MPVFTFLYNFIPLLPDENLLFENQLNFCQFLPEVCYNERIRKCRISFEIYEEKAKDAGKRNSCFVLLRTICQIMEDKVKKQN